MTSTGAAASVLLLLLALMMVVVATADYYVPSPDTFRTPAPPQSYVREPLTKPTATYRSSVKTPNLPNTKPDMAIEGFISCKSGYTTYPIQGAKVKVVCPILDSNGKLMAKLTLSSYPTDLNGYFYFITYGLLSHKVNNIINGCKVKLESSPLSTCKTPTNVNNGISGAPLSSDKSKFISHDNLNLYTLKPFYFSSPVSSKPVHLLDRGLGVY